jgi:hypothetical protein
MSARPFEKSDWILLALILVLMGSGTACYSALARVTTLRCDRALGTCTLSRSQLHRSATTTFPAAELLGAQVLTTQNDEGSTQQLVLLTTTGMIPFTRFGPGGGEAQVADIRDFVKTTARPTLVSVCDERIYGLGAGGGPFVAGVLLGALAWRKRSA